MNKIRFIAEFGSNHMGNFEHIKEAIHCAERFKVSLKLQLFGKNSPEAKNNVWLNPKLFEKAYAYSLDRKVDLSASVFSEKDLDRLLSYPVKWVKIPYSKRM